MRHTRAVTERP